MQYFQMLDDKLKNYKYYDFKKMSILNDHKQNENDSNSKPSKAPSIKEPTVDNVLYATASGTA